MMDTMGQAAAMTGGYGNSYAQSVGQQTYQGYLQGLNDKVPELYNLALNQYNQEKQDLYDQASLMAGMEDLEYGRYRDTVSDYYTELDRLTEDARYKAEDEYGKWMDKVSLDYQMGRDEVEDAWRQKEFDEAVRQYNESMAASKSSSGGGGGGGGGYDNGEVSTADIKKMQAHLGVSEDGKWGTESKKAAGGLSADEAWEQFSNGTLKKPGEEDTTPTPTSTPTPTPNYTPNPTGFTGSTYIEACAFLQYKGKSTSGLMTSIEWSKHKSNNNSAGGEHEANNYREYLQAFIYDALSK